MGGKGATWSEHSAKSAWKSLKRQPFLEELVGATLKNLFLFCEMTCLHAQMIPLLFVCLFWFEIRGSVRVLLVSAHCSSPHLWLEQTGAHLLCYFLISKLVYYTLHSGKFEHRSNSAMNVSIVHMCQRRRKRAICTESPTSGCIRMVTVISTMLSPSLQVRISSSGFLISVDDPGCWWWIAGPSYY